MESVFEIIAEPNRRAILSLLVSSQQSVGEIERQLRMPQPTVSKHLRVLRDSPEEVWQALTDPAHLREWAPFDADGNLGTAGTTVKLTTVGAPALHVTETKVTRADAPRVLEYDWGGNIRWELEAIGGGT